MICQDTKSSKTNSYRSNKDFPTFSTILKIEKSGGFPAYTRAKSKNVKKNKTWILIRDLFEYFISSIKIKKRKNKTEEILNSENLFQFHSHEKIQK